MVEGEGAPVQWLEEEMVAGTVLCRLEKSWHFAFVIYSFYVVINDFNSCHLLIFCELNCLAETVFYCVLTAVRVLH